MFSCRVRMLGLLLCSLLSWMASPGAVLAAESKLITSSTTGMTLTLIPAGTFMMGSPESESQRRPTEGPQHPVEISHAFYMGVYEVTQGEYESVMGSNPSWFSTIGGGKESVRDLATSRFPVECVSWDDAHAFCVKLSEKDGVMYRLPTEAEWEYACRAGTTTPYHFGSTLNGDKANADGNNPYGTTVNGPSLQRTTTVGSYGANDFGLHDMAGNVWEWCEDVYDPSAYGKRTGTTVDPLVTSGSENRVVRSGGWGKARNLRSALRYTDRPDLREFHLGFRIVSESVRTP